MPDLKSPDFQLQISKLLPVLCSVSFLHSELSQAGSALCAFREVSSRSLFLYCIPVRCGVIHLSSITSKLNFKKEEVRYFHGIRRWGWNSQKTLCNWPQHWSAFVSQATAPVMSDTSRCLQAGSQPASVEAKGSTFTLRWDCSPELHSLVHRGNIFSKSSPQRSPTFPSTWKCTTAAV